MSAMIHFAGVAAGTNPGVAIFSADVPTGTTATITVTLTGNAFVSPALGIYSVDDALLVSTTPSVGASNTAPSVTSLASSSFTQTAGGFVVAANALFANAGGTGTSTSDFARRFWQQRMCWESCASGVARDGNRHIKLDDRRSWRDSRSGMVLMLRDF